MLLDHNEVNNEINNWEIPSMLETKQYISMGQRNNGKLESICTESI